MQSKWLYGFDVPFGLADRIEPQAGMRILNIGCGFGKSAIYLASKYGCCLTAMDISDDLVKKTVTTADKTGVSNTISTSVLNKDDPKTPDGAFDAVFAESILAFIHRKEPLIREIFLNLRPGGTLALLELINLREKLSSQKQEELNSFFGLPFQPMDEPAWRKILTETGFSVMQFGIKRLTLRSKFLDDFHREKFATVMDMGKALWTSAKNPQARRMMREFRSFFDNYPDDIAVAASICRKPVDPIPGMR